MYFRLQNGQVILGWTLFRLAMLARVFELNGPLRESIDLLKENFRDELKKDGVWACFAAPNQSFARLPNFHEPDMFRFRLEAGCKAEEPPQHPRPVIV